MNRAKQQQRGQAIIMVTLSMILIFGMMGLAIDLGWGFFVKRSAQAAADAAALAAARKAFSTFGQQGSYACGTTLDCQPTPVSCTTITNTSNLYNGCQYGQKNFDTGVTNNRGLMMNSGTSSPFTTATGTIQVKYWVTATAVGQIPAFFS